MRKYYDFSDSKPNPYAKQMKTAAPCVLTENDALAILQAGRKPYTNKLNEALTKADRLILDKPDKPAQS